MGDDASVATSGGSRVVLRTVDLAKAFGATQALRSCSFELRAGEVHAVIGENGSGKSTLVKILTGVYHADRGSIEVGDASLGGFRSPRAALEAGIVAVFQEILVVPPRSVLDNVWLGTDGLFRNGLSRGVKEARARAALAELIGTAPDLARPIEELSLSDRQACCIARALVRVPRVLILDEATSALDVATRERLFAILGRLAGEGVSVIFISHRMDEIEEIGDRVTVMRSGDTVATVVRGEASSRELVQLMTGSDHLTGEGRQRAAAPGDGGVVLRARGLRLRPGASAIDFELRAGELVGLAGLEGHGQDAFLHALRGAGAFGGEVTRETKSGPAVLRSPAEAAEQGVVYVPRERRAEAIFETLSVRENFALPTLGRDHVAGLLRPARSERRFAGYVARLGIRLARSRDPITMLSGGNQQKVVIARWLGADPRILLLNDPTRGIDIGAKRDVYELLAGLAGEGIAMVMLSTEVDEHVELMDRVLVFREYELFAELPREALTRRRLISAFFGRHEDGDA